MRALPRLQPAKVATTCTPVLADPRRSTVRGDPLENWITTERPGRRRSRYLGAGAFGPNSKRGQRTLHVQPGLIGGKICIRLTWASSVLRIVKRSLPRASGTHLVEAYAEQAPYRSRVVFSRPFSVFILATLDRGRWCCNISQLPGPPPHWSKPYSGRTHSIIILYFYCICIQLP